MNIREKMLKSLEGKFSFSYGADHTAEEITEKEEGSKASFKDGEEENSEDPAIDEELKSKLQEAEDKAKSYREKQVEAMEKARHCKNEFAEKASNEETLETTRDVAKVENASLLKTIIELKSKIEETKVNSTSTNQDDNDSAIETIEEVESLKVELKSRKKKKNYLEKVIDELRREVKEKEDQLNEVNEKCMLYKNQAIDENKAGKASDKEAMTLLREELEASKAKVNEVQEMLNSMEAGKEQVSEKLLEVTEELELKKYDEAEKLIELQKAYDEAFEKKDLADQTLDYTRKVVEDQRVQLSTSVVKIQHQKDMVLKKELERQKSVKQFETEIDAKEEDLVLMEKYIEDLEKKWEASKALNKSMASKHKQLVILQKRVEELEQKLQKSNSREKNKEIEEQKKVEFVNSQSDELQENADQNGKLEEKIAELEHELQHVKIKHAKLDLEGRKKLAVVTLVLDALKNKYNLKPEQAQVISDLETDIKNTTYAKKAGVDKKTKKTRDIGEWRSQSFRYAKAHTKNMCFLLKKRLTIAQKCAIGVGFIAISLGVLLLGKRMLAA